MFNHKNLNNSIFQNNNVDLLYFKNIENYLKVLFKKKLKLINYKY